MSENYKLFGRTTLFGSALACLFVFTATAFPQLCLDLGGPNPSTITENFNGLGSSPAPNTNQSTKLINLSALLPTNPPASRFLGRFDNTINDNSTAVNVPWAVVEEGNVSTTVSGRYTVGNGSADDGNTYSFASTAAPVDRAFGSLTNDDLDRNLLGACFVNTTGAPITTVYINYTGEKWRSGGSGVGDGLAFQSPSARPGRTFSPPTVRATPPELLPLSPR